MNLGTDHYMVKDTKIWIEIREILSLLMFSGLVSMKASLFNGVRN